MAESGSNFTTAADLHMMFDLSSYMSNSGSASTGNHAIIGSWFWATWSPNRPIVGGIQTDDADEIQWGKINYLAELGLTPWYTVRLALLRSLCWQCAGVTFHLLQWTSKTLLHSAGRCASSARRCCASSVGSSAQKPCLLSIACWAAWLCPDWGKWGAACSRPVSTVLPRGLNLRQTLAPQQT